MSLSEFTVVRKGKTSDLSSIKKLNCCNLGLTDISIIERLPNIEVLSLSFNAIESLEALQNCARLQTLYVRKNSIFDIKQIAFLQNLPVLTALVLSDNPICESLGSKYRSTILRCLPKLKMLDEKEVAEGELQEEAYENPSNNAGEYSSTKVEQEEPLPNGDTTSCSPKSGETSFEIDAKDGGGNCQLSARSNKSCILEGHQSGIHAPVEPVDVCHTQCALNDLNLLGSDLRDEEFPQMGAASNIGENMHTPRTPLGSGGLGAQIRAETSNSAELLTSALSLIEIMDYHGLKVLNEAVATYLQDLEGSQ